MSTDLRDHEGSNPRSSDNAISAGSGAITTGNSDIIYLLVCTSCDHPLCGSNDVLTERITVAPECGFSYAFEDLLNLPGEEEEGTAPFCYRLTVVKTDTVNTSTMAISSSSSSSPSPSGSAIDNVTASPTTSTVTVDITATGNVVSTGLALNATDGGTVPSAVIPPSITRHSSSRVDVVRVSITAVGAGVRLTDPSSDRSFVRGCGNQARQERALAAATRDVNKGGGGGAEMEKALLWFPGYISTTSCVCPRCGTHLGWVFRKIDRIGSKKGSNKNVTSGSSIVNSNVSYSTIEENAGDSVKKDGVRTAGGKSWDGDFIALTLRSVKQREWGANEVVAQVRAAASMARLQAIRLLDPSSVIEELTLSSNVEVFSESEEEDSASAEERLRSERASGSVANNKNNRLALTEDEEVARQLDALLAARVSEAVEERTRAFKAQSDLLMSLVEKYKEQVVILSQLLKGTKEKQQSQDEKILTYEQIFDAHKQQLDTQSRHIAFQDELIKNLKAQTEAQQAQVETQHRIMKEQNSTIGKQNAHMNEMQSYLKSLVTTQSSIKGYLEELSKGVTPDVTSSRGIISERSTRGGYGRDLRSSPSSSTSSPSAESTTTYDLSSFQNDNTNHNIDIRFRPSYLSNSSVYCYSSSGNRDSTSVSPSHSSVAEIALKMLQEIKKHEEDFKVQFDDEVKNEEKEKYEEDK